jgi:hypothetical protein
VCSAGTPSEGGWPARLVNRQLLLGGHTGLIARNRDLDPASKMLAVAPHLALLPSTNECFAKPIAGTSCALDRPQRGWDRSMSRSSEVSNGKAPKYFRGRPCLQGPNCRDLEDVRLQERRDVSASEIAPLIRATATACTVRADLAEIAVTCRRWRCTTFCRCTARHSTVTDLARLRGLSTS